jgi:hypothetical protein
LLAELGKGSAFVEQYRPTMAQNVQLARTYLREGGVREVVVRAFGRVRRVLRERAGGGSTRRP